MKNTVSGELFRIFQVPQGRSYTIMMENFPYISLLGSGSQSSIPFPSPGASLQLNWALMARSCWKLPQSPWWYGKTILPGFNNWPPLSNLVASFTIHPKEGRARGVRVATGLAPAGPCNMEGQWYCEVWDIGEHIHENTRLHWCYDFVVHMKATWEVRGNKPRAETGVLGVAYSFGYLQHYPPL